MLSSFRGMDQEEGTGCWKETPACEDALVKGQLRCRSALDFLGRLTRRFGPHGQFSQAERGRAAFLKPPGLDCDTLPLLGRLRAAAAEGRVMGDLKRDPKACQLCVTLNLREVAGTSSENAHGMHCIYEDADQYVVVKVGQRTSKKKSKEQKTLERWLQQDLGTRQTWRPERAHRLVLWSVFGPPQNPTEYPLALHMCGNSACMNPEHLVWGTHEINCITDPEKAAATFENLLKEQGRLPES